MAEGILKSFARDWEIFSAGTKPARAVHPLAIQVMHEIGISLEKSYPKSVDQFSAQPFDLVITVCDNAKESCPVFTGRVGQRIHMGFEDPAEAIGPADVVLQVFRHVRDEIRSQFGAFYRDHQANTG